MPSLPLRRHSVPYLLRWPVASLLQLAQSLGFVAVVAAIVAGALLIRKYWEPISAFFGGVMEGLRTAFAPIAELFAPLKPMFDWLAGKLKAAWDWFNNLIAFRLNHHRKR